MRVDPKTMIEALRRVIKRLHFAAEVMLVCVRWYVAYPLSLRHLEEMMAERGVMVSLPNHPAGEDVNSILDQAQRSNAEADISGLHCLEADGLERGSDEYIPELLAGKCDGPLGATQVRQRQCSRHWRLRRGGSCEGTVPARAIRRLLKDFAAPPSPNRGSAG